MCSACFVIVSIPPSCARPLPTGLLGPASFFGDAELCHGSSHRLHMHDGLHVADA